MKTTIRTLSPIPMSIGTNVANLLLRSMLAVSFIPSAASAMAFTYALQVGAYQSNDDPSTFGTNGDVYLQLSNGASTNLNQTYTYQDIVGLEATTDGTFAITPFQPVTYTGTGLITDIFATTDAHGNLILNQPTINDPGLYPDGFTATSMSNTLSLTWYLWTYDSVTQLPIYYFKWSDIFPPPKPPNTASGVVTNVAPVPEPSTWMPMLLGVASFATARAFESRRRRSGCNTGNNEGRGEA